VSSGQAVSASSSSSDLSRQVAELRALVQSLEARVKELEAKQAAVPADPPQPATTAAAKTQSAPAQQPETIMPNTTLNVTVDTYYGYNFNAPIGRVNRLRAYDVTSNNFSLNQADLIVENAPNLANGKRWGVRMDLQWGQATQTLQGNPANEPRPEIYRNIFQAYGTYIIPIGRGITADFGKWSSALGIEGNYTKDQINYSRSLWFDFLPFYHMGLRANYPINDKLTVNYWVTNGVQQTEAFNGFKDQLWGFVLQPNKNISWTASYYLGQEHPDVIFFPFGAPPGLPDLPTQQGVPFLVAANPPKGRLHIVDTYATWRASRKWTLAGEGDWVTERLFTYSPPRQAYGGAAYARYQFTPKIAFATRAEMLNDPGGLFSGVKQTLKELTLTGEYKPADGFLTRVEYRHDSSNYPFFYTDTVGILSKGQTTATLGLVWWFGGKQGPW
jgi:hypothetical protein